MTAPVSGSVCALCALPATVAIEPARRTLARGLDPSDDSYSVTVILPDVLLCSGHAFNVRQGDLLLGWCDDEGCRSYGEAESVSACGGEYKKIVANRARTHHSK